MWILQVLRLQKSELDYVGEDGKPIRMIKPVPQWVKFLKDPLRTLKKKKEDFLAKNAYGPPHIANEEMFQELIEECTSNSIALQTIHDCLVQKINPNLPFPKHNNNRAMHYAARHGNIMMAMMLIRAGATIEIKNSLGQTPLMIAASGRFSHHTSFLRWIIGKGADIQAKDRGGNTALVLAVISSARTNVGILLHHKATVAFSEKKLLMLEDPDAIAIAKYLRAVDNKLPIELAEEYFELQAILGPSILDRAVGMGVCSESHKIVSMLERAQEGKYLNYYEIHLANINSGMKRFFFKYILRRKEVKVVEKKQEKVLQVQMADEADILRMMEAKKRAKELKRQQVEYEIHERNVEAARREIAAVQSADTLALLYGKTQAGQWSKKPEKKRKGKETMEDILIDGRNKRQEEGKTQVKSRWEFREIEADRSLGVKLDVEKFINYAATGGKTVDEKKEEKAIAKLVAKLEDLEGKKISDIKVHQKDFNLGGFRDLASRDKNGNVVKYKKGQRIVEKFNTRGGKISEDVVGTTVEQEEGYISDLSEDDEKVKKEIDRKREEMKEERKRGGKSKAKKKKKKKAGRG